MQMHEEAAGLRDQQAEAILPSSIKAHAEVFEEESKFSHDAPSQNISMRKDSDESFVYSTAYVKPSDLPQPINISQTNLPLGGTHLHQPLQEISVAQKENLERSEDPPIREE